MLRPRTLNRGGLHVPGTLLAEGESLPLASSDSLCRVGRYLGSGGEGEVWEVALDGGKPTTSYALKCYFRTSATQQQWNDLRRLVDEGSPDGRFLWPIDLVRKASTKTFGYVMLERDPRFRGLIEFLNMTVTTTFRALTTAGFQLADSYLRLHAKGLSYRDISFGNVFFDPKAGDILICDNDHVAIDGRGAPGILGTPRFMAPEIVRREALPSARTDLFSLSVLLFYMFIKHHPLQGARELAYASFDNDALEDLFGERPIFIFDPDDTTNRPVAGYHDNALILWPLCPPFIRDVFTRAFTSGIRDPEHGRVAEITWKSSMVRLRDSIAYCRCGAENFLDLYSSPDSRPSDVRCWSCGSGVSAPYRLRLKRDAVLLNPDAQLFPHHIQGAPFDFSRPVAAVTPHPTEPRRWGLKNLSDAKWVAVDPQGGLHDVMPGRTVRIEQGVRIQFRQVEGSIEW